MTMTIFPQINSLKVLHDTLPACDDQVGLDSPSSVEAYTGTSGVFL